MYAELWEATDPLAALYGATRPCQIESRYKILSAGAAFLSQEPTYECSLYFLNVPFFPSCPCPPLTFDLEPDLPNAYN